VPFVEQDDLVVIELAGDADRLRGVPRDTGDLLPRLRDGGRAVDSEHTPTLRFASEAGDHSERVQYQIRGAASETPGCSARD
jgi:hypothetical protein